MKEITDELINKRLEKLGFGDKQVDNYDLAKQSVLDHYNLVIQSNFSDSDFHIYRESTCDGYEVFVATHDMNSVNISENVYYYDSDLAEALVENIKYSNGSEDYKYTIYIEDEYDSFVEEAFNTLFEYLAMRFEEEVIEQLLTEGYEYKKQNPLQNEK